MSELQRLYDQLREGGKGHAAAIVELAERMNVDVDTVKRSLQRARSERRSTRRRAA